MTFGILESRSNAHPPGTVLLADNSTVTENTEAIISRGLKHGTGANKHIVLVPQPSSDPNDPLNWSIWYRDSVVLAIVFCTFTFAGATGPLLSPIAFQLVMEYNVSFRKVSLLTGWQLLTVAIVGFFVSPATRKIGKRPVIIVCSLLGLAGGVWLIFAGSYNSLLGARVLQAFGVAFYESVGFSMIADMYCVHERGSRIAAYLFPLGAFNVLCPLLAGVVAQNMGIKWMYRWMAIFAGLATAVALLYIPETAFNRSEIYNIDTNSVNNLGELAEKQVQESSTANTEHIESQPTNSADPIIGKKSYLYRLRPWSSTESFSNDSFISLVMGPLRLFLNPAVLWSCLTQGAIAAWTVAVSFIMAQIFAVPPYNYNPAQVGYLNTGAMVGGLFAEIICVVSNDPLAKAFARRNGGIYEPEFRLWLIIPMIITGAIGFFGFGNGIADGHGPIVASMFYGFITASLIFSHVASSSYMTDAFRNHSIEIFIDVMVFKNLLFFVFSLVVNDWMEKDGPRKVFNIIGSLQIAIGFLSLPLYLLGKKNRAMMHKWWFMN